MRVSSFSCDGSRDPKIFRRRLKILERDKKIQESDQKIQESDQKIKWGAHGFLKRRQGPQGRVWVRHKIQESLENHYKILGTLSKF